jgi:DNA-directed RNA polymerase specialized sigma24 family protein
VNQIERAPGSLEWHEGTHGWQEHDGFRRHAHSLNGVLTIDQHGPALHIACTPDLEQVTADARALTGQIAEYQRRIALLSDRRAPLVRTMHSSGLSMRAIGERLGVSAVAVHSMLHKNNGVSLDT